MKKKYSGSCHCGNLKFEIEADLEAGTGRCNCSYCSKTRNWSAHLSPSQFKWTKGEGTSVQYGFRANSMNKHHFCRECGVTVCTIGNLPTRGGEYVSVRVGVLNDVAPEVLEKLPIRYMDGLHDDWGHSPDVVGYL